MFTDPSLWLFALAWFLGGFVNSVGGMGAAMVALPIYAGCMNSQTLVPATCFCVAIISAAMSFAYWRWTRWASLKSLCLGAVPGSLIGLFILLIIPSPLLQLAAGIVMVLFVLWKGKSAPVEQAAESAYGGACAGFFSGLLNTSIGFGNPPVAIYSLHAGWGHLDTLASMNVFTLLASLFTIICHAAAGLYSYDVLIHIAAGTPATVLGMLAGLPIARRIHQEAFRSILLAIIFLAGCICLWRGFFTFIYPQPF